MPYTSIKWLKWSGIVTLVSNEGEFPCMCGQEDWAMKEAWEKQAPAEWRCDLARAMNRFIEFEE